MGSQPKWIFLPVGPNEKERDSQAGEFYADQILKNLVRESIQNSLDARAREGKPVRVRFSWEEAKQSHDFNALFQSLEPHYLAWQKRVAPSDEPLSSPLYSRCFYLAVEDFNTRGLRGPLNKREIPEGGKSDLYDFFMREGISEKGDNARGRRGLGKQVFLSASDVRVCFGWTVRDDNPPSLMVGMCVLGVHELDDKTSYRGDGWFAHMDGDELVPITDKKWIANFAEIFRLSRKPQDEERGLSVVSPYLNEELYEKLEIPNLLAFHVIKEYFFAILKNSLVVEIAPPAKSSETQLQVITAKEVRNLSLLSKLWKVPTFSDDTEELEPQAIDHLIELIRLARLYLDTKSGVSTTSTSFGATYTVDASSWYVPDWKYFSPNENELLEIKKAFGEGKPVLVTVRLFLPRRRLGYFDVILKRSNSAPGKATFIRNDLIISDIHQRQRPPLRTTMALVVIGEGPLSDFLGNAENPSHTKWEFTDRFSRSQEGIVRNIIKFVEKAPQWLADYLSKDMEKNLFHPFQDLFSYEVREKVNAPITQAETEETGIRQTPEEVVHVESVSYLSLNKINRDGKAGFCVKGERLVNGQELEKVTIRVAYRSRTSANPLKAYKPIDFDFSRCEEFDFQCDGCVVQARRENVIELVPEKETFLFEILGFDPHRDLHCEAKAHFREKQ